MSGFYSNCEEATCSFAEAEAAASVFAAIQPTSVTDNVYLLLLRVYQPSGTSGSGVEPTCSVPTCSLPDGEEGSADEVDLYYSDRGYESQVADSPAYQLFPGRLKQPLSIERSVPITPLDDQRVAAQVGAIELVNSDGALDNVVESYAVDGRRVRVLVGSRTDALSSFTTIFDGSGAKSPWSMDRSRSRLSVRDNGILADLQLQQSHYGGTGEADGTADVEGRPIPFMMGQVENVTPILVNPSFNIYQVHVRTMAGVDAVYDGGVALTFDGDYADYAALKAATIAAGRYATSLAAGLVRTQTTPTFDLTVSARGDAFGVYTDTIGGMMLRALQYASVDASKIDNGSFTSLASSFPYAAGIYVDDERLISDVLNELSRSAAAYWGDSGVVLSGIGKIGCGRILAPDTSAMWYLGGDGGIPVLNLVPMDLPSSVSPPPRRITWGYQKNYTVQIGSALAGSVSQTRRQFLAEQFRKVDALSTSVEAKHNLADDWPLIQSNLFTEAGAIAIRDEQLALHALDRKLFRVTLNSYAHAISIGETVRATWPRYGLATGRNLRVVGKSEDAGRRRISLKLWG